MIFFLVIVANNVQWVSQGVIVGGLCAYKWWETLVVKTTSIITLAKGKHYSTQLPSKPCQMKKFVTYDGCKSFL
jgi:hypothetical protein